MTRKIALALAGLVLLIVAVVVARSISGGEPRQRPQAAPRATTVFTETVQNTTMPIVLTTSGNLKAKNRVELYAEVQGVLEQSGRAFKPGVYYPKGATLIKINSDEHLANLRAQKSSLYNQIVLFLPDLRLDYQDSYAAWEAYIRDFSVDSTLKALPEPASEQEKLFVSGRNVYTAWYNVKNLEERLTKYTLRAPFSGVLTEAIVDPGTLIRSGQKLGAFIDTSVFELEVAISTGYGEWLREGKTVMLHNAEHSNTWQGRVVRVNSMVDPTSQTIPVYIQVAGPDLREGMYLEAELNAREEPNTYEVNRRLLFEENKMYVVDDSVLAVIEVEPVYFKETTVIIRGLPDGTRILARAVPNAHAGMRVEVLQE